MSIEIALFVLRLLSGAVLLIILLVLFVIMWRDYRSIVVQAESRRRSYGRLVVLRQVEGGYAVTEQTYPLLPLTSLGRAPTNTIIVTDTFASGEHALVALRNGQWWLEDRHSRNGTILNGAPISQPAIITDGDVIGVGQMRFRLELEM